MSWSVDYYRTERGEQPVKTFIDSLPVKLRTKNMREIAMLEEFGTEMPAPYVKQLRGKDCQACGSCGSSCPATSLESSIFIHPEIGFCCCTDS